MKKLFVIVYASLCSAFSFSQNVGIGIIDPTRAKLEVNGAVGATTAIFGGEGHGISLQRDFAGLGFNQYYNGGSKYIGNGFAAVQWLHQGTGWFAIDMFPSGTANNTPASFSRAMTLTPQGHIGIGGATPNGDLQFINSLNNRKIVLWESANNDHQYYGFGIESGTLRYAVDAPGAAHRFYAGNNSSTSSFLMSIGGDKRIIIGTQAGGSVVGINAVNPVTSLEIVQTNNSGVALIDPTQYNYWEMRTSLVGSFGNYFFYLYNGVGTSHIEPDGSYHSGSDLRLKKNITPMENVLPAITQLQPRAFEMRFNNPENRKSIGFIAQELKKYFPELVSVVDGSKAGYKEIRDLHSVNYSGLSVLAIKAIQEQQQIIQQQQKQIDELNRKLDLILNKQ